MEIKNNILVKVKDEDIVNGIFIIPECITEIGNKAFINCQSLISINIPNSVYIIGEFAFVNCVNLRKVIISDNVTEIGIGAFYNCKHLSKINIPNNIKCIKSSTFENCSSLINIEIPDNIIEIGNEAFSNCESLKEITIPKGVITISIKTFFGCSSLVTVNLLGNIEKIENSAFKGCKNLKKLVVPPSIKFIGDCVFDKCKKCDLILPRSIIDGIRVTYLDVYSLKINGKKIMFSDNNYIYHFGLNIKKLIKKELLVKIGELLKSKNINDEKYFKYKEHKELLRKFSNSMAKGYVEMDIEKYLNNYINGYLEDKGLLEEKGYKVENIEVEIKDDSKSIEIVSTDKEPETLFEALEQAKMDMNKILGKTDEEINEEVEQYKKMSRLEKIEFLESELQKLKEEVYYENSEVAPQKRK